MYAAGHNIVVYNTEDKSQYFLSGKNFVGVTPAVGSENTEGITAIAVSPMKKQYIAICERGEKAQCVIFDIHTQRKRKTLPELEQECNDYTSKEFVSVAFSPKNEKHHLITLTGEPDFQLLFWQWDKIKILAAISIGIQNPQSQLSCSFCPFETNSVVVTGHSLFKYYKVRELSEFVADHTQVNDKDP